MQARYYDPVIGRFLSNDPVGFASGGTGYFNRYAYTMNDPVNATDPTGEIVHFIAGAAIGAAIDVGFQVATNPDAMAALKSGDIGGALSHVDGKQVTGAAATGMLTGGAGALGKTALTGSFKHVAGKLAPSTRLDTGGRIAAGATGVALGGSAGGVRAGVKGGDATTTGEVAKGVVEGGINAVSPVPGAGTAIVQIADRIIDPPQP
jgi:uncharacterized protein RhaS with RHS repeats